MELKAPKFDISYQNKDIVSKLFGDRMKGKPMSLFGLESSLKVVDVRPTNIPIVRARELRMDNLFELEDGSVAIIDYESDYKEANFIKYGRYIMDVIDRYLSEGKEPDIHMIVLYTADVEHAKTSFVRTACDIRTEISYLVKAPSEKWMADVRNGISGQNLTDGELMHLVLLPLTYKGEEKKQEAIRECVKLAVQLSDKEQESFALAGILTFTGKIIDETTKRYIEGVLGMTQVGQMLMDRGRQEGIQQGELNKSKKVALKMLRQGAGVNDVSELLELPVSVIQSWEKESQTAE